MTEAEWLAAPDPGPMLDYLLRPASPRKLRLFAAACCRRVEHLLLTAEGRGAVDVAERNADGQAEQGEVTAAVAALDEDAVAEAGPGAGRFVFDRRAEAVAA